MSTNVVLTFQAKVDDALQNLGKLTGGIVSFKDTNKDAAGALGVFGVSLSSLNQPLTLVADTLKQSVTAAANWGDEMGDLAQLTGVSAREASKMAATFELVGVSTGTIEQALKAMTKNGLTPTIDTFKDLAEKYKAIQDPAEKNTFLFKNFGKAGMEMAEIMGRDTRELDKLAAAALRSGKVIGDDASGAAEEFNTNMAIFQQRVEGAQIALGNALIPTLNTAFTAFDQLVTIVQIGTYDFWDFLGVVDENTAAQMKLQAAGIDPTTASTQTMTVAISEATANAKDLDGATVSLSANLGGVKITTDDVKASFGELTKELIFNQAAASLDADGQLELGRQLGLVNETTYTAIKTMKEMREKYDSNHDGAVSAAEGAGEYIRELGRLKDRIDSLQNKVVTVQVVTVGDVSPSAGEKGIDNWKPPAGSSGGSATSGGTSDGWGDSYNAGPQAEGGDYLVTRPTWFLAGEAGPERATFTPGGGRPGGNTYILNVNSAQGSMGIVNDFALMRSLATV